MVAGSHTGVLVCMYCRGCSTSCHLKQCCVYYSVCPHQKLHSCNRTILMRQSKPHEDSQLGRVSWWPHRFLPNCLCPAKEAAGQAASVIGL
jgi:hypothetical protein